MINDQGQPPAVRMMTRETVWMCVDDRLPIGALLGCPNERIAVVLTKIDGASNCKIGIDAPADVSIARGELLPDHSPPPHPN